MIKCECWQDGPGVRRQRSRVNDSLMSFLLTSLTVQNDLLELCKITLWLNCKWSFFMRTPSHGRKHLCIAILDSSHPSVLISVRTGPRRVNQPALDWGGGAQRRRAALWVWAACERWKDEASKWNFRELGVAAQGHRASSGLYQHTRNNSPRQSGNSSWQRLLLLREFWAASLSLP